MNKKKNNKKNQFIKSIMISTKKEKANSFNKNPTFFSYSLIYFLWEVLFFKQKLTMIMKARINLSSLRNYMKNLKHNKFEKKIFIIIIIIIQY